MYVPPARPERMMIAEGKAVEKERKSE